MNEDEEREMNESMNAARAEYDRRSPTSVLKCDYCSEGIEEGTGHTVSAGDESLDLCDPCFGKMHA